MRVFVYDPGLTTGVVRAEVDLSGPSRFVVSIRETMELFHVKMPNEQVGTMRLWESLIAFAPDVVVGEDFRLFPDIPHRPDPRGTAPDRILAMMDLLMHMSRERYLCQEVNELTLYKEPRWEKQMPGERTIVTDKYLRANDLWRTPKHIEGAVTGDSNHAMDAVRHLVVWGRKEMKL